MKNNLSQFIIFPFLAIMLSIVISGCKDKEDCVITCENNGILTINCECACPTGFEGQFCETEICTLVCQNNGDVTPQCECDCLDGFIGVNCETCVPKVGYFDRNTYWNPGATNYVDNVQATLPANYVLTGLGFSSSSTIMLAGRELLQNGTLGDEIQFRDGNNPNGSLDVFFIVPAGHIVTGVGFGMNSTGQVSRLVVNYSEMIFDNDCDLELSPPQLYDNNNSFGVDAWLKISDTSLDTRYYGFKNLEIRYISPRQVEAQFGEIINQF